MLSNIIAILAPAVNCMQLVPQLHKTFTTKRVNDLSCHSLLLLLVANILWMAHGYFIADIATILSSVITMIVNILLLTCYAIYNKPKRGSSKKRS